MIIISNLLMLLYQIPLVAPMSVVCLHHHHGWSTNGIHVVDTIGIFIVEVALVVRLWVVVEAT